MASSLAKINSYLPLKPLQFDPLHHEKPLSLSFPNKNHAPKTLSHFIAQAKPTINVSTTSSPVITTSSVEKPKKAEESDSQLAQCWPEIHGATEWEGLLDPMNPLLRKELIRYGEMAQACYDTFDKDPYSKYSGSSKYIESEFFKSLGLEKLGYDVTRFLYATAPAQLPRFFFQAIWPDLELWTEKASWMGYVAVSNDETTKKIGRRDITIAWRGTVTQLEWISDLKDFLGTISANKIPSPDKTVKVESGFLDLYTKNNETCRFCKYSARQQVLSEVNRLIKKYPTEKLSISITGHSLGSSLAILNAYDIAETGVNVRSNGPVVAVSVFSFAGPRVGNHRFKTRLEHLGVKVLRVINVNDIVPLAPGIFFNEHVPEVVMRMACHLPWSYKHVGVELALDQKNSTFLKRESNYVYSHDLEVYLHLLDGYHGTGHKFELATKRDHALINKYTDFLDNKKYKVAPNWKQDENKGMVRDEEGRWVQPDRFRHDIHPSEMHHHLKELGLSS
ncbi:hypothetical protein Leryth_005489 [Lithospermum erythrorhizon]|nr:hypothetical protein Leryth_005489 [Lithospermum erythrorhizon]